MEPRGRAVAAGSPGGGTGPARRRSRHPILVVDDDPLILAFVSRVLRLHGFDVRTAGDGREALRLVYGDVPAPAMLIADVSMPGMGGIELAARLTADRPGLAVVLMTADPPSAEAAADRPELVRAVLLKPFEVDDLVAVVRDIAGDGPGPAE